MQYRNGLHSSKMEIKFIRYLEESKKFMKGE